jgi:hypothetical protein
MIERSDVQTFEEEAAATPATTQPRLVWWREIALAYAFYFLYSRVRGKGRGAALDALENARRLIEWERTLGMYHEHSFQQLVLTNEAWIFILNNFYGTAHFVVTPAVIVFLFRRHPASYRMWRNVLGWATGLALVGYYMFPLMPPRLVPGLGFTDTMVTHPNMWKITPIPIWNIGNPYAAMPSLHIGWSLWVCFALLATVKSPWVRGLAKAYPVMTLVAIVGTGNHFVLDAVGGAMVFGAAMLIVPALQDVVNRLRTPAALPAPAREQAALAD